MPLGTLGKNDIAIELRLLTDFVNAYEIMAVRIGDFVPRLLYYGASLPSMNRRVLDMLISDKLQGDRKIVQEAIGELKAQSAIKFVLSIRLQMLIALGTNIVMACIKILYCWGPSWCRMIDTMDLIARELASISEY